MCISIVIAVVVEVVIIVVVIIVALVAVIINVIIIIVIIATIIKPLSRRPSTSVSLGMLHFSWKHFQNTAPLCKAFKNTQTNRLVKKTC